MGSTFRKVLIASGLTVAAALAATAWILMGSGSKSDAAASQAEADLANRTSATPSQATAPSQSASPSPSSVPTTAKPTLRPKAAKPKPAKPAKKKTAGYQVVRTGTCQASFYGEGQQTASGETFNPSALTAANKTMPFGTKVRVINEANGKSVIVRINDRGPYAGGRCLDLSTAAMKAVGGLGAGVITAKYQVLATG